jgi:hypothetical protein
LLQRLPVAPDGQARLPGVTTWVATWIAPGAIAGVAQGVVQQVDHQAPQMLGLKATTALSESQRDARARRSRGLPRPVATRFSTASSSGRVVVCGAGSCAWAREIFSTSSTIWTGAARSA